MNKDLHSHLAEHAAESTRIARGVTADQLAGPTPCTEFDTRALVNHWVVYTSHGMEHRARRTELPEELTKHDFTTDPAWAEGYATQLDRAVAAWAEPAAWEGEIDLGGMKLPAEAVVGLLLLELALHGWDVARATGQEYRCSTESGEAILAIVRDNAEIYRQYQGFAEPVAVPVAAAAAGEGVSAFEQAVALSGRNPAWQAVS